MIKSKVKTIQTYEMDSVICDVCKVEVKDTNWEESQEFLYIRETGGFGSIFGDGSKISADICQHCVKKLLGAYIRVEDEA